MAVQQTYNRNIHPSMNITWGTYPSEIGHENTPGCFRCHTSDMEAPDGSYIDDDCETCHEILTYEADKPYEFSQGPTSSGTDYAAGPSQHEAFFGSLTNSVVGMPVAHKVAHR